jgi:dipeptidyl aminopeptidase/acylaminoacyl peptidase
MVNSTSKTRLGALQSAVVTQSSDQPRGEFMLFNHFKITVLWPVLLAAVMAASASPAGTFLTTDDVVKMEAADEFRISPDGEWIAWVKSAADMSKNKRNRHIYLTGATEGLTLQLTRGDNDDRSPEFSPDGTRLAFLGKRGEKSKPQIYTLDLRGGEAKKITNVGTGVGSFQWLDNDSFLFIAREDSTFRERQLEEKKDDVIVVADQDHYMPVRLFRYDLTEETTARITTNQGVITEFATSPDGRWVVTNENQSVDYRYDNRVPPKQFLIDLQENTRTEIFDAPYLDPYDFKWSADSDGFYCRRRIASDSTDAYVGISRLFYYDLESASLTRVVTEWQNGLGRGYFVVADGVVAALADGTRDLIAHIVRGGDFEVYHLEPDRSVRLAAAHRDGNRVVYFSSDASTVPEVVTATVTRGRIENRRKLIDLNEGLREKTLVDSEVIRWSGARGDTVDGILYYPAGYDTAYSYPLVVLLHGGPSGVDPDFFTERWSNYPHVLAAKGTFVLKVNYHGSGNYGLEWVESIKERYYELEVRDILAGIDSLVAKGNVDDEALGIMGWSNGSILAIQCCIQSDRFKVLCAGAGDVNWTSDYGNCAFGAAFDNAYFGGPPWELQQVYVDKSPLFRLRELKTPTLIMFGEKDRSVPTEQGWEHFRAMQQIDAAPARFLLFPGAGHGLSKPSHQKRKMEEELAWFDRYLFLSYEKKNEAFDPESPLAWALVKSRVQKVGYLVGRELGASIVPEVVELEGIRISCFEITRAQFSAFDPNYTYQPGTDNHPVTEISLPLAQTYCLWLSEKTGHKYRLPTEQEMEKLMSAAKANLPYENNLDYWVGYSPDPDELEMVKAKIGELEKVRLLIEPVGSFRPVFGAADNAAYDLGGNVAEWVTGENGRGKIRGLSAVSPRNDLGGYSRPPMSYVGFRVVESQ